MAVLMDKLEQKLKALDAFKDWSNYLLVTTVAALGWTAKDATHFCNAWMKSGAIFLFALSTVFAILTLALIPHVAELIKEDAAGDLPSIYYVYWDGWWVKLRLTYLCFPQHVLFLLGILLYAAGATLHRPTPVCEFSLGVLLLFLIVFLIGQLGRVNTKATSGTR
jgi:hypothetical protein